MKDYPLERGGESPFGAYELLTGVFGAGLLRLATTRRARRRFAGPIRWGEIALIGITTHKLTLTLTQDRVTMPFRAPFTLQRDEGPGGAREEEPVTHGLHRALGELVTCPYCTAPWVATSLVAGYVVAPLATRVVTSIFTAVALSDLLNRGYAMVQTKSAAQQPS
jgi:hypothetical protein